LNVLYIDIVCSAEAEPTAEGEEGEEKDDKKKKKKGEKEDKQKKKKAPVIITSN
jgi:hypothetical protein